MRLVCVCDVQEERARTFGERYDVPYFTDMHAMMRQCNDKIDVVSILTPSGLHARHTIEIAP